MISKNGRKPFDNIIKEKNVQKAGPNKKKVEGFEALTLILFEGQSLRRWLKPSTEREKQPNL